MQALTSPVVKSLATAFGRRPFLYLPKIDILAYYSGSAVTEDGDLKDVTPGRGDHEATKAVSLKFSGAQYGELAETVTLVGDFIINFKVTGVVARGTVLFSTPNGNSYLDLDPAGTRLVMTIAGVFHDVGSLNFTDKTGTVTCERVGSTLNVVTSWGDSGSTAISTADFIIESVSRSSTTPFNGTLWDFYAEDETGVKFHNHLAQKSDTGYIESVVGPAVQLNGFTLPDDFTETSQYGHSWNKESYFDGENLFKWSEDFTEWGNSGVTVSNNTTLTATGTNLDRIYQKITVSLSDGDKCTMRLKAVTPDTHNIRLYIEQDVTWEVLLQEDIQVTTTEQIIERTVTSIGGTSALTVLIYVDRDAPNTRSVTITDFQIAKDSSAAYIKTTDHPISGKIPEDPDNKGYTRQSAALNRIGTARQDMGVTGYGADLDGSETLAIAHLTGAETITTKVGTSTVATVAGGLTFTAGTLQYLLLSDDTELIFESGKLKTQTTVYNVDGTFRHGTFSGATTPTFTAEFQNSYLAEFGGRVSGNDIIPLGATTDPMTFTNPLDAPADVFLVSVLETLEYWQADSTNNKWLDASGNTIQRDPTTIEANYADQYFKSAAKGLALYDLPQIDPTLTKILRWMKIS